MMALVVLSWRKHMQRRHDNGTAMSKAIFPGSNVLLYVCVYMNLPTAISLVVKIRELRSYFLFLLIFFFISDLRRNELPDINWLLLHRSIGKEARTLDEFLLSRRNF